MGRRRTSRRGSTDVHFIMFEPNKKKGKVICGCTKASSDLIAVLWKQYHDMQAVLDNIHYDEEAKAVMTSLIARGITNEEFKYIH